jgi:hypothetical protein
LDKFKMANSPAIHAKNRNLASTTLLSLSQNTQEMKATVVE